MKWEYLEITDPSIEQLNKFGSESWDLVYIVVKEFTEFNKEFKTSVQENRSIYIFKRPVAEQEKHGEDLLPPLLPSKPLYSLDGKMVFPGTDNMTDEEILAEEIKDDDYIKKNGLGVVS